MLGSFHTSSSVYSLSGRFSRKSLLQAVGSNMVNAIMLSRVMVFFIKHVLEGYIQANVEDPCLRVKLTAARRRFRVEDLHLVEGEEVLAAHVNAQIVEADAFLHGFG